MGALRGWHDVEAKAEAPYARQPLPPASDDRPSARPVVDPVERVRDN